MGLQFVMRQTLLSNQIVDHLRVFWIELGHVQKLIMSNMRISSQDPASGKKSVVVGGCKYAVAMLAIGNTVMQRSCELVATEGA